VGDGKEEFDVMAHDDLERRTKEKQESEKIEIDENAKRSKEDARSFDQPSKVQQDNR